MAMVLSKRQIHILSLLSQEDLPRTELEDRLASVYSLSKATVVRDLSALVKLGFIDQKGLGPSTYYAVKNLPCDLPIFDLDEYFKLDPDKRKVLGVGYNPNLIDKVDTFFTKEELTRLKKTGATFAERIHTKGDTEIKKELERFIIELSWKSSQIEGNTYTLLDTENLLKNNVEAPLRSPQEKQMILNHKYAFDYIMANLGDFKDFNLRGLEAVHSLIVRDLGIRNGLRLHGVGISGTKYIPLASKYLIEDALNKLTKKLGNVDSAFVKAFSILLFVSYIQPFADGNKRTARMLSNAILLANYQYPLSYRSVDEVYYKKAQILFYEQHNIYYFKQIFIDQHKFSVDNYFI